MFALGLGILKYFKAHITVKQGAHPKFHRSRSVQFALEEAIKIELTCLESDGVIEKVNHSELAAVNNIIHIKKTGIEAQCTCRLSSLLTPILSAASDSCDNKLIVGYKY